MWTDLVIAWVKLHKVWSISLQECDIFVCKEINSTCGFNISCRGSAHVSACGNHLIYGI